MYDDACGYIKWICDRRPNKLSEVYNLLLTLRNWMLQEQPIGVITYTHYANVIGQFLAWSVGIRYRLATQRNPSWSYPFGVRLLDKLWGTVGIYTANIYVSQSVANSFGKYPNRYRSRSRIVLNGLRIPRPSLSREEARQKLAIPPDAVVVVNVGRLAPQKNQEVLISAIAKIPNENVILLIAGDGELRSELSVLVDLYGLKRRVRFLGELPPSEIPDLLVSSDIFAFPSRYEAFGFALVEAMMLGLPVLVSDIAAHKEVVGDAGVFLPTNDPRAWSEAIMLLSEDVELRKRLGMRAKERAALYTLDSMVDGYLEALFGGDDNASGFARHYR
ncbi:MAG: glycosyltransferase family 4 protein [Pyrobaculum sp.]